VIKLLALPAFADNYIWVVHQAGEAWAVDPGDAAPLQAALTAHGLSLRGILVTHHHPDHIGGLGALAGSHPCPVWGPATESIVGLTHRLRGGDTLELLGQTLHVIDVPGHTAGHIAYWCPAPTDGSAPLLFCGDTLFGAGCGRLFEGTPAQMQASLAALAALPGNTRVCCTHEYTLDNLRFALQIEPNNPALVERASMARQLRELSLPTLPSSIALERATNPFLRWAEPDVIQAARTRAPNPSSSDGPVAVFAALRSWKNVFR
jgi:hydroxyacylglutathione hydrolase